ncbi:hypothetical protein EVB97_172 [Rhizobium phage RHph_Y65]|uniref:Uncharacterized protein n=1 Tax=Rhizobium phage RHph_Y65 TaxID=2509785 RepID=A0A7S5RDH7_9CAUD|nr:hypothetical protein PQC17_gp172 [Rhizobium phage RHph_Y65]QIG72730.1 hypothetical protein EVB97_172 [Rhizobium phage RHph_Y65]QIG77495.1 hypothetical protein EVB61_167 [Rhizobium phage RHph_TM21B]QIG77757.1 hypothetical protein EVB64_170 [Rhizobium phage RHph_TM61]
MTKTYETREISPGQSVSVDKAKFTFYKESGKYYTEGEGIAPLYSHYDNSREALMKLNGGKMPGLSGPGNDFYLVIYPLNDESDIVPRLLKPGE